MKTAKLEKCLEGYKGDARLYSLSEPHEGYDKVIVSGCYVMGEPETYIFGVRGEESDDCDWHELEGSFKGMIDHAGALLNAGYKEDGNDG